MGALLAAVRQHRLELARCSDSGIDDAERLRLENSLIDFVEAAWPAIDVSEYKPSWAIDALCEHLQAVTDGQISRLLINFPPRCGKTLVASVCWPAWTWARRDLSYRSGPGVRFLCGSYGHTLSLQNSNLTRRLILSPWYQSLWGDRFGFCADQNAKAQFDNTAGGSRLATSVGGTLLGVGGAIIVVDDPHNTEQVESEAEREHVLNWWKELSTTRLNDPKQAALAVIMQRLHEEDVSGKILSSDESWVHLMIPMEYESRRHCVTALDWQDPRGLDDNGEPLVDIAPGAGRAPRDNEAAAILEDREGALMWPERFGAKEVAAIRAGLGPYMASGRLQQSPQPRSGGIFKREWWHVWDPPDGKFPGFDFIFASLDGAFTEREENDPSGFTVWGVFQHPELRRSRIMLIDAWRKHLQMHGNPTERLEHETAVLGDTPPVRRARETQYVRRVGAAWGLVEWTAHTCKKWRVQRLLIEDRASGITAAQEMQRLYGNADWNVQLVKPKGDKTARALAVQPTFAQGLVYAPIRDWSEMVIDEMAVFPKGRHDDLTDSATQAIKYLRDQGLAQMDDEIRACEFEAISKRSWLRKALYPC